MTNSSLRYIFMLFFNFQIDWYKTKSKLIIKMTTRFSRSWFYVYKVNENTISSNVLSFFLLKTIWQSSLEEHTQLMCVSTLTLLVYIFRWRMFLLFGVASLAAILGFDIEPRPDAAAISSLAHLIIPCPQLAFNLMRGGDWFVILGSLPKAAAAFFCGACEWSTCSGRAYLTMYLVKV